VTTTVDIHRLHAALRILGIRGKNATLTDMKATQLMVGGLETGPSGFVWYARHFVHHPQLLDFVQAMLHSLQHIVGALGLVAEVQRVDDGVWPGLGSNLFPYDSGLFPFPSLVFEPPI